MINAALDLSLLHLLSVSYACSCYWAGRHGWPWR